MSNRDLHSSYEETPYLSLAYAETSLEHLEVCARLRGFDVASPSSASVLELGCSSGGNLIPMARRHPGAQFLGIDFSGRQIERAQKLQKHCGVSNVDFVEGDIEATLSQTQRKFDFVIAHGLLSWISPEKRARLLPVLQKSTHSKSLVYVSYNVKPGSFFRAWTRAALQLGMQLSTPKTKPQDIRSFVQELAKKSHAPLSTEQLLSQLSKPWPLIVHDELEVENHDFRFSEIYNEFSQLGFQYVGDTVAKASRLIRNLEWPSSFRARQELESVEGEELLDFCSLRSHRNSLFFRGSQKPEFQPKVLRSLFIQSPLKRSGQDFFEVEGKIRLSAQSAEFSQSLQILEEIFPQSISVSELLSELRERNAIASPATEEQLLLKLFETFEVGALRVMTKPITKIAKPESPRQKELCLLFSDRGQSWAVNELHQSVFLEGAEAELLSLCDGQRSLEQLHGVVENLESTLEAFRRHLLID